MFTVHYKPLNFTEKVVVKRLTDHGDGADTSAGSGGVLYADTVAATVLSLGPADVETEVSAGAVEA